MKSHYTLNSKHVTQEEINNIFDFIEANVGPMSHINKTYYIKSLSFHSKAPAIKISNEETEVFKNRYPLEIILNYRAMKGYKDFSLDELYYELSHECVHLVSPYINPRYQKYELYGTNVLEEGVATYISLKYLMYKNMHRQSKYREANLYQNIENYFDAFLYVEEMLKRYGLHTIIRLREEQPCFNMVRPKDFYKIGIKDDHLIRNLLYPFQY